MLGDGLTGVDLDHVRDPHTGAIIPWAKRVISALNSYTELSPSGTGYHIFFLGAKPRGRCNLRFTDDGTAFEIYDRGRFFTVTGQHVEGTPRELREIPLVELEHVCAEMLARLPQKPPAPVAAPTSAAPVTLEDSELLRRMFAARNGPAVARLYHGDFSDFCSQSDADVRLCGMLAFWTGRDTAQMDRLFRASGLMRDKWDSRRGASTYGATTIARACANCTVTFGGGR